MCYHDRVAFGCYMNRTIEKKFRMRRLANSMRANIIKRKEKQEKLNGDSIKPVIQGDCEDDKKNVCCGAD